MRHMFLLMILKISEIYPPFLFSVQYFGVVNNIQALFDGNTVLSYLLMDQPLKIFFWKKNASVLSLLIGDKVM